jgi:ribosome-associated protein
LETNAQHLATRIAEVALSKKGFDIKILDLRGISSVTDFFVIASGEATMHVNAIGASISEELSREGAHPSVKEGMQGGRWILLDYFDVVAHIFLEPVREFYSLEKLWGDAPEIPFSGEEETGRQDLQSGEVSG